MSDKKTKPRTRAQINRKANLLKLIGDAHGAVTQFSICVKKPQSYLWLIKNTNRGVGEAFARDVEKAMSLEQGWLDQDHSEQSPIPDIFSLQIHEEARKRIIPDDIKSTILHLIKTTPLK